MPRPAGEVQLKNTTLEVLLLPVGSRTVTEITVTNGAIANAGAETMSLSASANTDIKAGVSLSFLDGTTRKQALITDDYSLTSTPSTVNVAGLINNIGNAATAKFVAGLIPLFGIQEFSFSASPSEVDTTNTQSGYGMESALIRADKTIDISGIQIINDRALYAVIKQVAVAGAFFGREIYAVFTYADGQQFRGAAKIKNYSEPGNQNEVKKFSFQLQFQGDSFQYFAPHTYV